MGTCTTEEIEAGGSLESRSSRLAWVHLKNKKKQREQKYLAVSWKTGTLSTGLSGLKQTQSPIRNNDLISV